MHSRKTNNSPSMIVSFSFLITLLVAVATFADEFSIPGTSVSLDAPDGFSVATGFSGLQNLEDGSSITVIELPVEAYEELALIFSDLDVAKAGFAQQGVSIERSGTIAVGGQIVPILMGSQPIPGGSVEKYMALFRGDTAVLISFNIFDAETITISTIERSLASVTLSSAPTLSEEVEQLPFSFASAAPFRIGDVLGGSSVLLTSFEGIDPTGLMPVVIIVRALAAVPASDVKLVAQQLLRETQGFEEAEIASSEEVNFGGGAANYLEAVSEGRKIVQYLRVPANGIYVRLVAFGEIAEIDEVLSAVSEIARSVSVPE